MLPFHLDPVPGQPLHRQVALAVKRAIVSGRLRAGERFPSVRTLSKELKINPNTAHKVVATLAAEGLLEVQPGIGTVLAKAPPASTRDRRALLEGELERLVVEARALSLGLDELVAALEDHWRTLSPDRGVAATVNAEGGKR